MTLSLQDTLELLRSDRIKDRAEGISLIEDIFHNPFNVANLDVRADGKPWLKTFQALFTCVLADKAACLRKGSWRDAQPASLARLCDSTQAVRQLVERSVPYLTRRVVRALVAHLNQMLNHQGQVFQPVALAYLKSLSAILAFPAHVDNLDSNEWALTASTCFNALLDDDLSTRLEDSVAEIPVSSEAAVDTNSPNTSRLGSRAVIRPLGLEDVEHMACLQKLLASPNAPVVTAETQLGLRTLAKYEVFLNRYPNETSTHLPALSGLNELLCHLELNEVVQVIRFAIRTWRPLTNLWQTKTRQLKEQLVILVRRLAPVASCCLSPAFDGWTTEPGLSLAGARREIRSMLAAFHRLLLDEPDSRWGIACVRFDACKLTSIHRTAPRRLSPSGPSMFALATIRAGTDLFQEADALSWAALELNASIMSYLFEGEMTDDDASTPFSTLPNQSNRRPDMAGVDDTHLSGTTIRSSPTKRRLGTPAELPATKRRRQEAVNVTGSALLVSLLEDIRSRTSLPQGSSVAQQVMLWRIQALLFLVTLSFSSLSEEMLESVIKVLCESLADGNSEIQSWCLIGLAEIARLLGIPLQSRLPSISLKSRDMLSHAWSFSLRKLSSSSLSRAASHLASTLLNAQVLPLEALMPDVRLTLSELDIQGPGLVSDSACTFLAQALAQASFDMQLYSTNVRGKALSWLLSQWQSLPFGNNGVTGINMHVDWTDVYRLACAIMKTDVPVSLSRAQPLRLSGPIFKAVEQERQASSLRPFILERFPHQMSDFGKDEIASEEKPVSSLSQPPSSKTSAATPLSHPGAPLDATADAELRRLLVFLERQLTAAVDTSDMTTADMPPASIATGHNNANTASRAQLAQSLQLALLALAVRANLRLNGMAFPRQLAAVASGLLVTVLQKTATSKKIEATEQASLLQALGALSPFRIQNRPNRLWTPLFARPGVSSGVREFSNFDKHGARRHSDDDEDAFLTMIWQELQTGGNAQAVLDALHLVLASVVTDRQRLNEAVLGTPSQGQDRSGDVESEDDDFIGATSAIVLTGSRKYDLSSLEALATESAAAICVSLIVSGSRALSASRETARNERLVSLLLGTDLEGVMLVGPGIVRAVAERALWLSQRDTIDILERIGSDLLGDYRYARDEQARLLAVDFAASTIPMWLVRSTSRNVSSDLAEKLRKLCVFFAEQAVKPNARSPWRVRCRIAELFEEMIRVDPGQDFWLEEEELVSMHTPTDVLLHLNSDPDVRVRASGACSAPSLFEIPDLDDDHIASLYDRLNKSLPTDHGRRENIASRVLCLTNVVICSSGVRRLALFHLIEIFLATGRLEGTMRDVIGVISRRLGFQDPRQLYHAFAGQITWGLIINAYDPLRVPYKMFGFSSRKECVELTFRESGPMMIAAGTTDGKGYFDALARLARKPLASAVQECLPFLAASQLGFAVEEQPADMDTTEHHQAWENALQAIAALGLDAASSVPASNGLPLSLTSSIASVADEIVLMLLTMQYDSIGDGQDWAIVLANSLSKAAPAVAGHLKILSESAVRADDKLPPAHEPNRPFFPSRTVYHAILALKGCGVDTTGRDVAYHVLRQLFLKTSTSSFVNDQHRYLEAAKLYMAMCAEHLLRDHLMLDVLLHGVRLLIPQLHLLSQLAVLAEWMFHACTDLGRLQASVASTITAFAEATSTGSEGQWRDAAMGWLESEINILSRSPQTADAIDMALILWPGSIPKRLSGLAPSQPTLDEVITALEGCDSVQVTPALLSRIKMSLKFATAEEKTAFASNYMWMILKRLKSSRHRSHSSNLPGRARQQPLSVMSATLADSLSELLFLCGGRLRSPGLRDLERHSASDVSKALRSVSRNETPRRAVMAIIVLSLLEDLRSEAGDRSAAAFVTLRGVLSGFPELTAALGKWPEGVQDELAVLSTFATPLPPVTKRSINELLKPETVLKAQESFDSWISTVTASICHSLVATTTTNFFVYLAAVVETSADAAAKMLPLLLHLCTAGDELDGDPSTPFLLERRQVIAAHFADLLANLSVDQRCWAAIVNGILHVRRYRLPENEPTMCDLWYPVSFALLARRSLDCQMYTAALVFVELAFEYATDDSGFDSQSAELSSVLYEVYSNVDDPDGFYGISNSDIRESLSRRLHHEGEWHRALQLHAASLETSVLNVGQAGNSSGNVGRALHMLGFNHLASNLVFQSQRSGGSHRSGSNASNTIADTPTQSTLSNITDDTTGYDMAWRTGTWDLPTSSPYKPGTSQGLFTALRALHRDRSGASLDTELNRAFGQELEGLINVNPESINEARRVTLDLLSIREIRSWKAIASRLGVEEALNHVRAFWADAEESFDLETIERTLSVRQSILQAERTKARATEIGDMLSPVSEEAMKLERTILLRLSSTSRGHGRLQASINATAKAQKLQEMLLDSSTAVDEEFCSVLWDQGEHAFALGMLKAVLDRFGFVAGGDDSTAGTSAALSLRQKQRQAVLMAQLGEWRATARCQQPRTIDMDLFQPSLELLASQPEAVRDAEEQSRVAYKWAKFADEQYRSADVAEINRLRLYIDRRKEEIRQNQLESDRTTSKSLKARLMQFQRQADKILRQDQSHLNEIETARTLFLHRALAMYSRTLASADIHDDAMVRLTSLWFENAADEEVNSLLSKALAQIPSHKFLSLTHQLSARLSSGSGANGGGAAGSRGASLFQSNISDLLLRMCRDHPFHTMYAIYALVKGGGSDLSQTGERASSLSSRTRSRLSGSETLASSQKQRAVAAEEIWNRVKLTDTVGKRIESLEEVCRAYVEWAEVNLSQQFPRYFASNGAIKRGPLRMPGSGELRLSRLRDVEVPVATADTRVDLTCKYESVVSIVRYSDTFTTAGGIHLPKINECIGSDGRRYKQLFKRDDDLRQDAVMQQVFRTVNDLLRRDRRAHQRHLTVRTYAVIPLGPQCGMLEFVTNTIPIGEMLVKLHARYGAHELSPLEARAKIREAQGFTAAEKLEVFLDVCERMPPKFRFFFSEMHKHPPSWFAMRLNYVRSVATTSIVGHVLGLGDRHVSNILLDRHSGELVHIDFGVAFDQVSCGHVQDGSWTRSTK